MTDRLQLLSRPCTCCGVTKPWAEFLPRERWEDGSVRNVYSHCKECNKLRHRRYRKDNPEKVRAYYAQHRAENAEARRIYNREYRRRLRAQSRALLPVGPLRLFLLGLLADPDVSQNDLADLAGVPERAIRRILNEQQQVSLRLADTLVTRLGGVFSLIYDLEEVAA